MNEQRPRRCEVGDRIRSPKFAEGWYDPKDNELWVGPRKVSEGDRVRPMEERPSPERGEKSAVYTVIEAKEESAPFPGGFLLRGPPSRWWAVTARRVLPDGTEEVIRFNQFGELFFLHLFFLIPDVIFLDDEEREEAERARRRAEEAERSPYDPDDWMDRRCRDFWRGR